MNFFTFKKTNYKLLTVALSFLLLSACSTSLSMRENTPPALFSQLENNATYYLEQTKVANDEARTPWQLVTLQALISEHKLILAQSLIEHLQKIPLDAPLTLSQNAHFTLLMADKFYAEKDFDNAQKALNQINKAILSPLALIHFYHLQIDLNITAEAHLEASENIFQLLPLLRDADDDELQKQHDSLLNQLALLSPDTLALLIQKSSNTTTETTQQAWYELAQIYQSYQLRPNQLLRKVNAWQTQYPAHPASDIIPSQLVNIDMLSPYTPKRIGVILPLSGRFELPGNALQTGFLDAYYKQIQQQKSNNTFNEAMSENIFFYDSQTQNMQEIEAQLRLDNIDFVVGPLLKENIQTLLPLIEDIPTLALNALSSEDDINALDDVQWHYAFPLSPEEEAKQAAELITYQQHKHPLVIAPKGSYGERVSLAFSQRWESLHPAEKKPIERHYFTSKRQLGTFVDSVLQNKASKRRILQMQAITLLPLETEVRSRRDIDAIYIISKRDELILLKPFIDVSVSPFAKTIPLYASSRSNSLDRSKQNKELSQLIFSDSPFLLAQNQKRLNAIQKEWKNKSFSTLRLYALGFDSYQLINQLVFLQHDPKATYNGAIGKLSVTKHNLVHAKLSWAKFENGVMFDVPAPTTAK
ncbi:LppC family lipoprotein [Psychromonas sp. CNPT3]|uniref:penicillin-binding protein activator n=1 Tax=Psychromonas sp. CNPT3 TaxID=314282 RepID=UPI0002C15645|nr:penicillin-binding protein activator [Psychromonas sp. CNPT3]AGH80672.1 LppC family lipoprotein [Psychromonas sp. CNPT3]